MAAEQHMKNGGIAVETEHIFPIIKKWLYSEKEIFLRELVSNATDAITKLKRLTSLGQYEGSAEPYKITVSFNKTEKTLTVSDNGIGMTEDELVRYICNMALSGALEFVQKYEGETKADASGIIGHFGLGFYSAFMVADQVEIITKSYTDAPFVHWTCQENGSYQIDNDYEDIPSRGTSIIMHINDEGMEYLSEYKLRETLEKYCSFMPVEIYLVDEEKEEDANGDAEEKADTSANTSTDSEDADTDEASEKEDKSPKPVNDVSPLWTKPASECTTEEYNAFYSKVFHDYQEPLFHLHLNADYPLNFKGILYFPKIRENYESLEGKIKLYYNQVFVADNIKEVIPEYLLMLRGVLDCPELPLNVSRSYLQNSGYVTKISAHIVKKVADKLLSLANNEKERYESIWKDLKTFVEYGCISDRKFYDRVKKALLFTLTDESKISLQTYLDNAKETHENKVYYATDTALQSQYISLYTDAGNQVVVLSGMLEERFLQSIEQYEAGVKFVRVDADIDALKNADNEAKNDEEKAEDTVLEDLFKKFSDEKITLDVSVTSLASSAVPAILTISEETRRMEEMMKMYMPDGMNTPTKATLVINRSSALVEGLREGKFGTATDAVAKHIYALALLSQRQLSAEEMKAFLDDAYALLGLLS